MTTYSRNFEFRKQPKSGQRDGRFMLPATSAAFPIGAPVLATGPVDPFLLLQPVALATGAQVAPYRGRGGLGIYEYAYEYGVGHDRWADTFSDYDTVKPGQGLWVGWGDAVKVVFRNSVDYLFQNVRTIPGRTMVAGLGALAPGDLLTPGTGTDAAGYWAKTTVVANGWFVVTSVDTTRLEVEAECVI